MPGKMTTIKENFDSFERFDTNVALKRASGLHKGCWPAKRSNALIKEGREIKRHSFKLFGLEAANISILKQKFDWHVCVSC